MNGPGTQTLDTGGRFSGGFRHGVWHGLGIFLGEDGSQFEGSWVGGAQHGPGKLTTAGGDVVEGCWLDNVQTGYGASWNREGKLLHMGRYENGPRQVCPIPRSALPAATHLNKQGRLGGLADNNCARTPTGPLCAVRSRRDVGCSFQRRSAVRLRIRASDSLLGSLLGSLSRCAERGASILYPDGRYYIGAFSDNLPHGEGRLYNSAHQLLHAGYFHNGVFAPDHVPEAARAAESAAAAAAAAASATGSLDAGAAAQDEALYNGVPLHLIEPAGPAALLSRLHDPPLAARQPRP